MGDISERVKEFLGKIADWLKNAWGRIYQKYLEHKESNPGEISDPGSLMPELLQGEPDEVITTTIITVTPEVGALVVMQAPEDKRAAYIATIAAMETPSTGEIQAFRDSLPDELKPVVTEGISGPELASKILNIIDPKEAERILSLLDEETRSKLSSKIFTFDNIENMENSDLKLLISNIDKKVLTIALLGSSDSVYSKIESVLDTEQKAAIQSVVDSMDSMPNDSQSDQAKKEIVNVALIMESEGKITLPKSTPAQTSSPQDGQGDAGSKDTQGDVPESEPKTDIDIDVRPIIAAITATIGQDNPEATRKMRSIFAGIRYLDRKVEDKIITALASYTQVDSIIELVLAAAESDGPTPEEIELSLTEDLKGIIDYSTTIPRYERGIELSGRIMAILGDKKMKEVEGKIKDKDVNFYSELALNTLDLEYILLMISDDDAKNLIGRISRDKALLAYKTLPERRGGFGVDAQSVLYYHATGGGAAGEAFLEDIELMGRVKRVDAESAALEIVNLALDLEEKGEIKIRRDSDPKVEYM